MAASLPLLLGAAARSPPRRIDVAPASREFLLLGRQQLFAVHRLRYQPGCNYQLVLRLHLPGELPRPWRRARRRGDLTVLHTSAMDLRSLRPGPRRARQLHGAAHTLDGRELLPGRDWMVQEVQVYAEVDPQQPRPPQLEYYLFGRLREWYGMHVIGGAPDFEQILSLPRLPPSDRLHLPLENTAVNARREAPGRQELHFATLPEWSP